MPLKEEVLGQFLGDEAFPIEWTSETEKLLFWVYDDLHCPKPLSPMYEDIGGWWLSCDHMFRRFGTPFATDWVYKNINGYLYTAAIPAEAGLVVDTQEYNYRTNPVVPEAGDADYAARIGAYLGAVLPVYGNNFVTWWRERFVPEMERNFEYIEGLLDRKDELTLAEVAVLLEDAIDMHDRHWKIHWMLNFAQLSATLNLRAVMERTHGKLDEVLLGRLQNSANDRNWDKIRALWEMKEEVKADADLAVIFEAETAVQIVPALQASERGRRFIEQRVVPYQKEFGWHAVWSHEFIFPSFREDMNPVIQLVHDQVASDYDYPAKIAELKADIDAAASEILEGLEGEALEEMRAADEINLRMAPLTPDHHFYIDQGANAHVRLVLMALGEKLVEAGVLDAPDDVILFRYNQLRAFIGDASSMDGRAVVAAARARRAAAEGIRPRDWVGTATETQLAFPYLNLWGFPDKFHRSQVKQAGRINGIAGSPGVVEGVARVVSSEAEFDSLRVGEILVCQMTNPAWQVLYGKIIAVVTDAGGTVSHPAVLAREYGIPAVVGTSTATSEIKSGDRLRVDGSAGIVEILGELAGAPMADDIAIRRSVLSDQVKGRLLQAILEGRYPPGARIVETRVARELGTSQAPVREALRDLEALGVVETSPFRGARVRQPTTEQLLEAFDVRTVLEGYAARLAIANVTEADLRHLAELLERMREAARAGDPYAEATADAAFHGHIVSLSGNATLERVWRTLEPFLRTYITIAAAGVDRRAVAERHVPIIEALRGGEPDRVEAAFRTHFAAAAAALSEVWPNDGASSRAAS